MWIFSPDSFVSIVAHRTKPDVLLVRARLPGDLERMFPGAKVKETRAADYRFRAELPRHIVADEVAKRIAGIDYDNVKGAIPKVGGRVGRVHDSRAMAMHRCWDAMHAAQVDNTPAPIGHRDMR